MAQAGIKWKYPIRVEGKVVPTDGCGMAFTLIRRQVFEAMLHPAGPEWTNWFELPKNVRGLLLLRSSYRAGLQVHGGHLGAGGHLGYDLMGWWSYELYQRLQREREA